MRIQAVLFDMDGTLVDSEGTHQRAVRDVLDGQGLQVTDALLDGLTGLALRPAYDRIVAATGLRLSYADLVEAKHAAYTRRSGELRPRPGALDALKALRERGIRFAVVSNSDRVLVQINLAAMGLTQADRVTVSRNDVRLGKPDAEPYLRAAWLLGLEPAQCLVVEDSVPGASAGLAAGMRVLAWPEPHMAGLRFPRGVLQADPLDLLAPLQDLLD